MSDDAVSAEAEVSTKRSAALEHAWNWFRYHAEQRLKVFQFFIAITGVIATGLGAGLGQGLNFPVLVVAIFGMPLTVSFYRLDRRVSALIKIGEVAMRAEEMRLSINLGDDSIRICEGAENPEGKSSGTYSDAFRVIFFSAGVMYFATACYALYRISISE